MIKANRFESLNTTTNLGLADFQNIKDSAIYNTVSNKLEAASDSLMSIIDTIEQGISTPLEAVQSAFDESVRSVTDVFSAIESATNFTPKDIEDRISEMFPDDSVLKKMFKSLTSECRDNAMNGNSGFKPFDDSAGCGSPADGKCGTGEVSGLLDKATGGMIGKIARSIQNTLKAVMTLAKMGYSAGMCKIFSALINNLPNGVVQRASAGVLAAVGTRGNTKAVLDIGASLINRAGVNPAKEVKGLVNIVTSNFKKPSDTKPNQEGGLFEGVMTTFDIIDKGFDKGIQGVSSVVKMATNATSDFKKIAGSYLASQPIPDDPDVPFAPAGFEYAAPINAGVSSDSDWSYTGFSDTTG